MSNLNTFIDIDVYRESNQDLKAKSDADLRLHYEQHGKFERRTFSTTWRASDRISMQWLRGNGLEIGPGKSPCQLYGPMTNCKYSDVDYEKRFGSENVDYYFSVDQNDPLIPNNVTLFDFVIAIHVLEHADSFLKALKNIIDIVKVNGIIYIALPSIDFDHDKAWLPYHDFKHHIDEYNNKSIYSELHQNDFLKHFIAFASKTGSDVNSILLNDPAIINSIESKQTIPEAKRFFYHKHNYSFQDWTRIILASIDFLNDSTKLVDCQFGSERMDCHFVLQKI